MGDLPGEERGERLVEDGKEGMARGTDGREGESDLRVNPGAMSARVSINVRDQIADGRGEGSCCDMRYMIPFVMNGKSFKGPISVLIPVDIKPLDTCLALTLFGYADSLMLYFYTACRNAFVCVERLLDYVLSTMIVWIPRLHRLRPVTRGSLILLFTLDLY